MPTLNVNTLYQRTWPPDGGAIPRGTDDAYKGPITLGEMAAWITLPANSDKIVEDIGYNMPYCLIFHAFYEFLMSFYFDWLLGCVFSMNAILSSPEVKSRQINIIVGTPNNRPHTYPLDF